MTIFHPEKTSPGESSDSFISIPSRKMRMSLANILPECLINIVDEYYKTSIIISNRVTKIKYIIRTVLQDESSELDAYIKAFNERKLSVASMAAMNLSSASQIMRLAVIGHRSALEFLISQADSVHFHLEYRFFLDTGYLDMRRTAQHCNEFQHDTVCSFDGTVNSQAESLGIKICTIFENIWNFINKGREMDLGSISSEQCICAITTFLKAYLKVHPVYDCVPIQPVHAVIDGFWLETRCDLPCDCYENYPQAIAKKILDFSIRHQRFNFTEIFFKHGLKPRACIVNCLLPAQAIHFNPKHAEELVHIRCHAVFRNLAIEHINFWLAHGLNIETEIVHAGLQGLTILMVAIRLNQLTTVQGLLKLGASKTDCCISEVEKYHAETPLECSQRLKYKSITDFLMNNI